MRLSLYGSGMRGIPLDKLLEFQRETDLLTARAEDSGCEGCYVEVAIWNSECKHYERLCFAKVFGGEHPGQPDADAVATAEAFASAINAAGFCGTHPPIIHRMPDYAGSLAVGATVFA